MKKTNKKRKVKKNSSRNNTPNYFGIGKSPSYLGGNSNISFLNSKQRPLKRTKQKRAKPLFGLNNKRKSNSKPVSFLTKGKVMPKQKYIDWNYKRIKKRFPGLNPYGDADMDGSMNYKDCRPFDASKDGFFGRALSVVTGGKYGQSKEDYSTERAEKKTRREGKRIAVSMARRQKIEKLKKGITEKFEKRGKVLSEIELQKKAQRKQTLKEVGETGAGVRALSRKVLYKKTPITRKGKVVGYKTVLRGGKPVSTAALKAVALAGIPVKIPKEKGKAGKEGKTYASAGRPKGPSGKYQIPGKGPVYEHEYKKWVTKQRALARIQAEQARGIPTEDISEAPGELETPEEYGEYETPQQQPQQPQQLTPEQIQRLRQIQQMRQAQQPQQTYPSRVSSQTAGGPVQDHILNAPNIARGELRVSQSGQEIQSTSLGARPQVNPHGEYYTNIDPMTGKQIMQRRVSEKFATGEAL